MTTLPNATTCNTCPSRRARTGVPARRAAAHLAGVLVVLALAGCGSLGSSRPVDPAAYAAMSCNDLNRSMAGVSTTISRTAITRGDWARWETLSWVPGRTRVTTAVDARLGKKIEQLQEEERVIAATRARNCPRQAE